MTRPTPDQVAEDAAYDSLADDVTAWSIDWLVTRRDELASEIRLLQNEKGAIEQELWRRAKEAVPMVEERGTAVLAGEAVMVTVGADRKYEYDEAALRLLGESAALTLAEYSRLVHYEPVVDGREFNSLSRRGGALQAMIEACRHIKSARATFETRSRK